MQITCKQNRFLLNMNLHARKSRTTETKKWVIHHQDHNYSSAEKNPNFVLSLNTDLSKLKATNIYIKNRVFSSKNQINKNYIPHSNHLILILGKSQNFHPLTQKPQITNATVQVMLLLFEKFSACPKRKSNKKQFRVKKKLIFKSLIVVKSEQLEREFSKRV